MADDLTPSPAARPPEPAESLELAPQPRERRRAIAGKSVFPGRFALAYALVAVLVGVAVGGFVVLSDRPAESAEATWSSWKPEGEGTDKARQIAEHISGRYRLETGGQLVGVIASQPVVQNLPVRYVAFARGSNQEDVSVIPAEDSISYQLCGLGQRCAIRDGRASVGRARLLHRQALELALYTFKYVEGVDTVVAFMPPRAGQNPTVALFFRRQDLDTALDRPLSATLPQRPQLSPADVNQQEADRIGSLTQEHLFQFSFQQAPDGNAVLVLQPPAL